MTPMMNNYYFQHQFPVKQIVYPIPPYMSIRRDGIEVFRFPVRSRKLMDMIKKFDPNGPGMKSLKFLQRRRKKRIPAARSSGRDITYIEDSSFFDRFQPEDATPIKDPSHRYFVISGDSVWAKYSNLSSSRVAKFKIVFHETRVNRRVITLKVQDQDLYLSYKPNPDKQLKVLPLGQKNLDFEKDETKEFFFYLTKVNNKSYSIESAKQPGSFLSTSPDDKDVRVMVQPTSENHHREFDFDGGYKTRGDDTIYGGTDRTFQGKYQSILARDDYIMDVTSLALDRSYRWPRQDDFYQSYHPGWRCI